MRVAWDVIDRVERDLGGFGFSVGLSVGFRVTGQVAHDTAIGTDSDETAEELSLGNTTVNTAEPERVPNHACAVLKVPTTIPNTHFFRAPV